MANDIESDDSSALSLMNIQDNIQKSCQGKEDGNQILNATFNVESVKTINYETTIAELKAKLEKTEQAKKEAEEKLELAEKLCHLVDESVEKKTNPTNEHKETMEIDLEF